MAFDSTSGQVVSKSGASTWQGVNWIAKYKTADETVTASAALQNDDHLVFAVEANAVYYIEIHCIAQRPSTDGDIILNWTFPASATYQRARQGAREAATSVGAIMVTSSTSFGSEVSASANGDAYIHEKLWVTTAGTAGNVQLQWAQLSATGSTVMKKGSWGYARRLS
jgi:hypothetical protein